jgi:anthranilate synthase component 2
LRTPLLDGRILPGVSRGRVLDAARDCGVEFEETTLNLDDLLEADEVFLTNALRGIQPAIVLSNLQETHTKQAAGRITSILHDALQVERLDSVRSFSRAGVQPTADCEQVYPRNTDLSRIVVIDNYDSFTYNLVHYLERMGIPVTVFRNSAVEIARLVETRPLAIVLSPGPCSPTEAGMCNEIVARMGETVPILGVCLGHQCIAQSFGARIARSPVPVHGRASRISHDGKGIFRGLPNCIDGARYHSLTVDPLSLPPVLEPTSWTDDGVLMGIRHAVKPIEGIQFHPESILTEQGYRMLENFIEGARTWSTEASVRNSAPRRPIATRS